MKSNIRETSLAAFTKQSQPIIKKVVSAVSYLNSAQGTVRNSIVAVGRVLVDLQTLAKTKHQSFVNVVESAPINLPISTAYHYIRCFRKANKLSARVFALATAAGLDPAQPRILKYLSSHDTSRWTAVKLANKTAKTHKTHKRVSARKFFLNALKTFMRKLLQEGNSVAEIKAIISPMIVQVAGRIKVVEKC